jgi:hypothetical protein
VIRWGNDSVSQTVTSDGKASVTYPFGKGRPMGIAGAGTSAPTIQLEAESDLRDLESSCQWPHSNYFRSCGKSLCITRKSWCGPSHLPPLCEAAQRGQEVTYPQTYHSSLTCWGMQCGRVSRSYGAAFPRCIDDSGVSSGPVREPMHRAIRYWSASSSIWILSV